MSDKKDKGKKKGKIINFVNRSKQNKKVTSAGFEPAPEDWSLNPTP